MKLNILSFLNIFFKYENEHRQPCFFFLKPFKNLLNLHCFLIFKIWKKKTVFFCLRQNINWAVFISDGFQIPDIKWLRVIFFFLPGFMDTATYFNAGSLKTEYSISNFSNACRFLDVKILPTNQNHLFFFHHSAESRHPTDLDLRRPPLQQATECKDI